MTVANSSENTIKSGDRISTWRLWTGISHRLTVLFICALTLWVGSLALGFSNIPSGWGFAVGATFLLIYLGWQVWCNRRKTKD